MHPNPAVVANGPRTPLFGKFLRLAKRPADVHNSRSNLLSHGLLLSLVEPLEDQNLSPRETNRKAGGDERAFREREPKTLSSRRSGCGYLRRGPGRALNPFGSAPILQETIRHREIGLPMHIAIVTAGGAGMFCGSCMHDNTWARSLKKQGAQVTLLPTYTPLRLDEHDESTRPVFLGGINVYLDFRAQLLAGPAARPHALARSARRDPVRDAVWRQQQRPGIGRA